ncbi:hypothetical protein I302_105673 [Kwoniella bestiolae CBS 10118]|uniref:Zn(2)-C6 fungal-type domain-containing protein n=1 Tax=Kwoniella bestiolae CBS 10118 TaxID=1296100 RepID=A0AAJ8KA93_9TREE
MSRPYNPKYDSVLGPMREPSPPPPSTDDDNAFHHDGSFLSQLDPSRVGVTDTEAALTHLFGDVVGPSHQHHHQENQRGQEQSNDAHQDSTQVGYTPTLASTVEALPAPTQLNDSETVSDQKDQNVNTNIDPSLRPQDKGNHDVGDGHESGQGETSEAPKKRKATSRANMLARGGACEYCKKRKLKCSAEIPSCSNCTKINKECVYSQKKQRSKIRVLEDRLQELEKRLDNPLSTTSSQTQTQNLDLNGQAGTTTIAELGVGIENFPSLSTFEIDEPDLMTLADAAAADTSVESESWDGLSPEMIVAEILKTITGGHSHTATGGEEGAGKSIGEKIVSHLIQLYVTPPSLPDIHAALSPTTLLRRLSDKTDRPIHPSLLLALIPYLLPLSPSKTLQSPAIPILIQTHGKNLINLAITNSDPRMIDLIAACSLRSFWYYLESKYFEGWIECCVAIGMVRSAGLDKLGHVGEMFVSPEKYMNAEHRERLEREKKCRFAFSKAVSVPPPRDRAELGERINLFWFAYMLDRGGSIGWRWPSSFHEEEITTPWPRAEYESDESLLYDKTLLDFINSPAPEDASKDPLETAAMKSLSLMLFAQRSFDTPPSISTERTARLIRLTKSYMATYGAVDQSNTPVISINGGGKNQVWVTLYATLAFLHAREEIDAPQGGEKEHFMRSIEALGNVLEVVKIMQNNGNTELEGLGLLSSLLFFHLGRLVIKYIERIEENSKTPWKFGLTATENHDVLVRLKEMKSEFKSALESLLRVTRFAIVGQQLLENIALGSEFKLGEYERADNLV